MPDREVTVALTVDTDADEYLGDSVLSALKSDKSIRGWTGFELGKDILVSSIEGISDSYGNPPNLSWFIRSDGQIAARHGESNYLLRKYNSFWEERRKAGDDLQWHAHLYREQDERWFQETDSQKLETDLKSSFNSLKSHGLVPQIIRIGESYHSNELMRTIADIGIKADSSALPGRKRYDEQKTLDWETTPNFPYRPSRGDYRIHREPAYSIWEIPMNTVLTKVSYDAEPILRYVNLSFHPGILDEGLYAFFLNHDTLVSITHPFELVPKFFKDSKMDAHPLLSFRPESVRLNLLSILKNAERAKRKVRFTTMSTLLMEIDSKDPFRSES